MLSTRQANPQKFVPRGSGFFKMSKSSSITQAILLTAGYYAWWPNPWEFLIATGGVGAPCENTVGLPRYKKFREIGPTGKAIHEDWQIRSEFAANRFQDDLARALVDFHIAPILA